ncbi:hypothetical protein SEA_FRANKENWEENIE_311 [Streptomyces phage Frankenweenie]|nr:hypothetical protein SEA_FRANKENWEENIE_311 [Streptomyces phage Frankenweenie]
MRYGLTVNNGRVLSGNTEEVKGLIIGVLLAAGFNEPVSVQEKADEVLRRADALPSDEVQGVKLASIGEMLVWRERGRQVPGRAYLVKKAGDPGPAFRATSEAPLVAYLMGILVGSEGIGLERSAALAEGVAHCLSEGGSYPDRVITELKDGSDLLAWWEDEK